MTRMIKAPGRTQDKYKDFKDKFNTVKVENQEILNRAKRLEENNINIKKDTSATKLHQQ